MIKNECTTKQWIERISKTQKADKILVEKVIRALILLEGLAESGLDFVFKGGTALMLMLNKSRRLSIDIDIMIEDNIPDLSNIIHSIVQYKDFIRFEKQERKTGTNIDKEHYKLFFQSAVENKESYMLLDVLKEKIHYQNIIETPINSVFIECSGEMVKVKTPDFNNLLGDKLTAFAPDTTGIPYHKGGKLCSMEIIKQLYDIASLFDVANDLTVVGNTFRKFADVELSYRNLNPNGIIQVLDDVFQTSLCICLQGQIDKEHFRLLQDGIKRIQSFIYGEKYYLDIAIINASKVAYLSVLIKKQSDKK
ncbi:MAG: nucleotidyl transferase AbiEii/AbiGii toxin family protein [Candidatus Azobacteroides sp.]|nr:nucleotidyl transferase AbiEii/AbiGii toxin family protein [Candidatus Azobacteroides sp.]